MAAKPHIVTSTRITRLKDRMLTWYMKTCDVVPLETDRRNFARA